MAQKISMKSFLNADVIYIAPILVIASFLHVFSKESATHNFGQIELFCALGLTVYYLWDKISVVYSPDKILKKRIEAIICAVVGFLPVLLLLPPLMTWQYYNLYKNSDGYSFNKQILAAILTIWIAVATFYGSFYLLWSDRVAAGQAGVAAVNAPDTTNTYVAPNMAPATN